MGKIWITETRVTFSDTLTKLLNKNLAAPGGISVRNVDNFLKRMICSSYKITQNTIFYKPGQH